MPGNGAKVGQLTVCPTPIGNLRDVTLRTLDVLREADLIACEDTRRTGLLLEHYGLRRDGASLLSLHEHNEAERVRSLLARVREGRRVALVSDAGMPLICDPGYPLLRAAIEQGLPIEVLPGPSALTTALVASGLPPASFRFEGFLPRRAGQLQRLLEAAAETVVAFESPRRLAATLALLARIDPERELAVCRELTKLHEQVLRGSARELAECFAENQAKGEIVLVIGAAQRQLDGDREQAAEAFEQLRAAGAKPRAAARVVASLTGISANELYRNTENAHAADSLRRP